MHLSQVEREKISSENKEAKTEIIPRFFFFFLPGGDKIPGVLIITPTIGRVVASKEGGDPRVGAEACTLGAAITGASNATVVCGSCGGRT